MKSGKIIATNLHHVSHDLSQKYSRTIVRGGEVLISLVGTIGVTAFVRRDLAGANLHRNVGVMTPGRYIEAQYLLTCLRSPLVKEQIREVTTGGNQPLFNLGDLKRIALPVPPLSEQKRIVSKVTHLLSQVTRLESTLTRREFTRTQLLTAAIHSLLNGAVQ